MTMIECQAESLDGHEHTDDLTEYVGICVLGHERRGWICSACAHPVLPGLPAVLACGECPDDDPRPRILVPAAMWDEAQEMRHG